MTVCQSSDSVIEMEAALTILSMLWTLSGTDLAFSKLFLREMKNGFL